MSLTLNTRKNSSTVQQNLKSITTTLSKSIGSISARETRQNNKHFGEESESYTLSSNVDTVLNSISIAQENNTIASSLLSTADSGYDLIQSNLQQVKDLTENLSNGDYSQDKISDIQKEVFSKIDEINKISLESSYNGTNLLDGSNGKNGLVFQVGTEANSNSTINLDAELFKSADIDSLTGISKSELLTKYDSKSYLEVMNVIDNALSNVLSQRTLIGNAQNNLDSTSDALDVQYANVTSTMSSI